MRVLLPTLLLVAFGLSVTGAQAEDGSVQAGGNVKHDSTAGRFPGGGWDANNLRISVSRSRLLSGGEPAQNSTAGRFPGGGWDGNNLRISVSHSKLFSDAR